MNPILIFLAVAVWVALAAVNFNIAEEKGRSGAAAFFGSVFFCPLVVWGYLVAVPALPRQKPKSNGEARDAAPNDRPGAWRESER